MKGVTNTKQEKSCGAVVVRRAAETEYLLVQHLDGHWGFPKGHVENSETEEETAKREIREETGLETKIDSRLRVVDTYSPKPGVTKDVIYFLGKPVDGTLRPQPEEISEIRWCTLPIARGLLTFDSSRKVLDTAVRFLTEHNPAMPQK